VRRNAVALAIAVAAAGAGGCRPDAAKVAGGDPARGVEAIGRYGCGACHAIPGVEGADAVIGPSLDHIASRTQLAGQIENSLANMMRWIQKPQEVRKDTLMPDMEVTDQDARDIAAHLYTLK
jgi:cytochrome c